MADAVIVSAVRTAVGKAPSGALRSTRPDELAAVVLKEALHRAPGFAPSRLVVNQAALKIKRARLQPILAAFEKATQAAA